MGTYGQKSYSWFEKKSYCKYADKKLFYEPKFKFGIPESIEKEYSYKNKAVCAINDVLEVLQNDFAFEFFKGYEELTRKYD